MISDLPWVHEQIADGREALIVPSEAASSRSATTTAPRRWTAWPRPTEPCSNADRLLGCQGA